MVIRWKIRVSYGGHDTFRWVFRMRVYFFEWHASEPGRTHPARTASESGDDKLSFHLTTTLIGWEELGAFFLLKSDIVFVLSIKPLFIYSPVYGPILNCSTHVCVVQRAAASGTRRALTPLAMEVILVGWSKDIRVCFDVWSNLMDLLKSLKIKIYFSSVKGYL